MREHRNDLAARVLEALAASDRGPMKAKDVARALRLDRAEYRELRGTLAALVREGRAVRVSGQRYALPRSLHVETGVLALTRTGDGFVRVEGGERGDVFVPAHGLATAMDGDRVVVRIERRRRGRSREGRVIRIIERARETVVGTFHEGGRFSYVTPLDVRLTRDVLVARDDTAGARTGEVVVVRFLDYGEGRVGPSGVVERVLGPLSDPGVDVLAVAYGFGVSLDFPEAVLAEASRSAREGMAMEDPRRIDRTGLLCFTIDPADAKDHDDALSVVEIDGATVEVGIHIADVSHFVPEGGAVDVEALSRGTSVYLVDRTVPMLPPALSSEVCSLNPREDRFALSLFVRLDSEARVLDRRYERTRIHCRHGLSYEEAQGVLDGAASIDPEVDQALRVLDRHAQALRVARRGRGALDMDIPEAKVILGPDGAPTDIQLRERRESHRLIEDFMILANEVVANDLEALGAPALFRVHEPPTAEKVEELSDLLDRFGLAVRARARLRPSDVQELLEKVRGRAEEALVSMAVLRSLKKARYDPENLGHFGLASTGYLHFTSPIRRYPDLIVHRAVADWLLGERGGETEVDPESLLRIADQCSAREQAAEEAERASVALKKVEFMERHLGDTFAGRISGVVAFGFFVTLEAYFVEGLVHVSSLRDDFYRYEDGSYQLVGDRRGRRYRLGDRLEVQVARVDKESRRIDFTVVRSLPRAD